MPTQKQNEANLRNAQSSTGPKSPAGQAAASQNSLKHGLLASDLAILADPASRDAATALLQDFNDFYLPRTPIERALIRQMAILQHRLEAAPALETGIFTHGAYTRYEANLAEADNLDDPEQQRTWRNQIRGRVFAIDCEGPNAIPKLIRYETVLSNRFLKCVDRFLRFRQSGPDQPGEPQPGEDESLSPYNDSSETQVFTPSPPELPNEPNYGLTPLESVSSEAPPEPSPASGSAPPAPRRYETAVDAPTLATPSLSSPEKHPGEPRDSVVT